MSHAEDILDGSNCESCGRFIGPACGYTRECHVCKREQAAVANFTRMAEAQQKELTPSMVEYYDTTHVIRIIEDRNGSMTCTVRSRDRKEKGVDVTITFPKKNKRGVLWTFMSADRLCYLAFAPTHQGIHR